MLCVVIAMVAKIPRGHQLRPSAALLLPCVSQAPTFGTQNPRAHNAQRHHRPPKALVAARPRGADVEAELRQIAAAATAAAAPRAARFSALRGHAPAVTASVLYPLTLMLSGLSALSGWTPNLLLALGASPRGAYAGNTAMMAAGLAAAVIGACVLWPGCVIFATHAVHWLLHLPL